MTNHEAMSTLPLHPKLRHPLTGLPLRAIGWRPTGEPLWPIMGGAPDDPPPDDTTDWTKVFEGKTPAEVQTMLAQAQAKAAEAEKWSGTFTGKTPEQVKADARKHEQRAQANKTKAEAYDGLVTQLGIAPAPDPDNPDDDKDQNVPPDVAKAAVDKANAETRATKIENAVLRHAPAGVSGVALVDSREFMSKVSTLDPAADDFTDKLGEAIKTATEGEPGARFRVGRDRPGPDPRRGLTPEGKTGSLESGRTAYEERKKQQRGYAHA